MSGNGYTGGMGQSSTPYRGGTLNSGQYGYQPPTSTPGTGVSAAPTGQSSPYGNPFNFGQYPGSYGGGYGGGFFQPMFNYQNAFQSMKNQSATPTDPTASSGPTPNTTSWWGSAIASPTGNFNGPHDGGGGTTPNQMQPIQFPWNMFGNHNGGMPQQTAPTPTATPPVTTPGSTPPVNPPNETRPTLDANPKVGQVMPQTQGPITPIQQAYNPMGDGYTGTQGQYQIRQNPLIGQALNTNPQAVFQMLGGGGGDPMSRYTAAGNALQGSGFGGGDFNTAYRNLQQALQGVNLQSLSSQYSGLPSYFTGG